MEKTYLAQGECTNCGHENYPQWGEYDFGRKISDHLCPNCKCMTLRKRQEKIDPDFDKCGIPGGLPDITKNNYPLN